jgi:hypothetical protein
MGTNMSLHYTGVLRTTNGGLDLVFHEVPSLEKKKMHVNSTF